MSNRLTDAQLEALPVDTQVRESNGYVWTKISQDEWDGPWSACPGELPNYVVALVEQDFDSMITKLRDAGYTVTEPHREDGWYQLTDGGFSHVRYSDDNVWYREVNNAGQGCDSMFPATMHYTSIIYLGPYVETEEWDCD